MYQNPLADPHTSRMSDGMVLMINIRTSLRKRFLPILVSLNLCRGYNVQASSLVCARRVILLSSRSLNSRLLESIRCGEDNSIKK